jgi:hypothetical protein
MHGEDLKVRLTAKYTIDSYSLPLHEMEWCRLTSVFNKLVAIIIDMTERNIAFQALWINFTIKATL